MNRQACRTLALWLLAWCAAFMPLAGNTQEAPLRPSLKDGGWPQPQPIADAELLKPGDHSFTIQHDGLTRKYRVHVPSTLDPAAPAPLLFALHGGGGSMDYQADDGKYGLIGKSEREGFVVVFPNGFSRFRSGLFATWNAGTCCGAARDRNVDDVGFIRKVLADVTRRTTIDRSRIYATGMSNGGLMAYRLACEMSDIFKAIAPVAGTDNTRNCTPAHPVSVLHIHARNDSHVLYDGGAGPDTRDKAMVTDFTSVPQTVAKWVRLNGCSATARRIVDRPGAYCEVHAPCQGQAEVQLCVTQSGGHSWPGGSKPRGETPSQAISANDVMWEFFARH